MCFVSKSAGEFYGLADIAIVEKSIMKIQLNQAFVQIMTLTQEWYRIMWGLFWAV